MNKFLFLIFTFCSSFLFAASILQTKGKRILISLDGDTLTVGQTITLKNTDDKVVATAVVSQVKGGKAIANVTKGEVDGSETIETSESNVEDSSMTADNGDFTADTETETKAKPKTPTRKKRNAYRLNAPRAAALFTMGMNTMITKQADSNSPANTEDVSLTGTSMGLAGSFDYPMNSWLILRGTLGYEPFAAKGSARFFSCDNRTSRDCDANISYLSAGGFARINFTDSKFQMWGAGGATFKMPLSKTSTALRVDDIKMTVTFAGALGADYFISNKTYIPASVEFQLFQSSETVAATAILLRAGYGWAF